MMSNEVKVGDLITFTGSELDNHCVVKDISEGGKVWGDWKFGAMNALTARVGAEGFVRLDSTKLVVPEEML